MSILIIFYTNNQGIFILINQKKNILILGEDPTDNLDDSTLTAKKNIS